MVPKIKHLQIPGWENLHQGEAKRPYQLLTVFQGHASTSALPMPPDRLQKQLQANSRSTAAPVRNWVANNSDLPKKCSAPQMGTSAWNNQWHFKRYQWLRSLSRFDMLGKNLHLHSINPPVQTNFACVSAVLTCWPGHELLNLQLDLQLQTFESWNRSFFSIKMAFHLWAFWKEEKKYYYLMNLVTQTTKLLRDKSQKVPDFHVMLQC